MSKEELEKIYQDRLTKYKNLIHKQDKKDVLLIVIKLLLFLGGCVLFLHFFTDDKNRAFSFLGIFFLLFTGAALVHERILDNIKYLRTLITINEKEITALHHQFIDSIPTGSEFIDRQHYYTSDLDIFGERSLFHYINRTVTEMGHQALALSLKESCREDKARMRREGVSELAPLLDFRQEIQAAAPTAVTGQKTGENLSRLFDEDFLILGKHQRAAVLFIHVLPLLTTGLFAGLAFHLPLGVPLIFTALQVAINKITAKKVQAIYRLTGENGKILKAYAKIFACIEKHPFKSRGLQELQHSLRGKQQTASTAIKKLSALMEWFDMRGSFIHVVVNHLLLWDLNCVYRIEKWKKDNAGSVGQWFDTAGEMEVLSSFANLYFNNPYWTMPEIRTDVGFLYIAEDLGHPLISLEERVSNDFCMTPKDSILIITGPNMAGKSTFLRTLGVNCVLALAGSAVCAKHLEISPVRLITSMQSSDSLDKQLSLFYAELQRLKLILDYARGENREPVFFLVDEMLKGTNALDRQKGSIILLDQLDALQANGVTATHDLQLTHLEKPGKRIKNYHFDGFIEENRLLFDFKLIDGVCKSSNALELMKQIGIYP